MLVLLTKLKPLSYSVYQGNGYFGAHKDHLALTILMPLTSAETDFEGGGTGYWSGSRVIQTKTHKFLLINHDQL